MFTFELSFIFRNPKEINKIIDKIELYLGSLRKNGQILGKEHPLIHKNNSLISYVFVPEKKSLNKKYSNKYVLKNYNEIIESKTEISCEIIGKEIVSAKICRCSLIDNYILYTDYLTLEPPLRCGNCFGVIPLYKIPKTYDDEYYDILSWETQYQSCDTLQMNCCVGEKFGTKQMSDYNSDLTKCGIDICSKIKTLTGKNVYYYLYRYVYNPIMKKEINRKCPSCGGDWILENTLFEKFNFKCDECSLLSNISKGV
ncbi:MAG: Zn-ribbon-containing protein [Leptospirales bacterium]|nr:Zn-ribbon-containing protein [Leptospirales bacterium]